MTGNHQERAHSKFSASGSERWLNCAASVELEETMPKEANHDSFWSLEGTAAHELLEDYLMAEIWADVETKYEFDLRVDENMKRHCRGTAIQIKKMAKLWGARVLVEKRIYNTFIHEEMFGTCDVIIPVYGDVLHIIDFKYGSGHIVDPTRNTQLIQYALGVAESYDWKFKNVSMHIMQPRAGKKWHKQWSCTIEELKNYWLPIWMKGVARVDKGGNKPFIGSWCYWCKAKSICPAKINVSLEKTMNAFKDSPLTKGNEDGKKEKGFKKEISQQKSKRKNPFS